jgi:16S rRNA G966 N2-methylase RsmD
MFFFDLFAGPARSAWKPLRAGPAARAGRERPQNALLIIRENSHRAHLETQVRLLRAGRGKGLTGLSERFDVIFLPIRPIARSSGVRSARR